MTDTVQLALQPLSRGIATFVPEALSAQLFHAAQPRHVKAGERLFAIGDPGEGCFLLEQGLLKATVASPLGEERVIAILGPGAIVGELSMIDGLPRSASVVAMRDCVLRFVIREAFQQRANTKSETHQVLLAILAPRLREVDEDLAANLPDREGARDARIAQASGIHRTAIQRGTYCVPGKDHPGRSCGDGRSGAGKCESRFERVAAAQFRDWILAPLLS